MTFWKDAGFTYLKYVNISGKALRSILKGDAKIQAMKRDDSLLKVAPWSAGKQGESVYILV